MSLLLADDLSGALEAGAAFRAFGWKPRLYLSGRVPPPEEADDLLVASTESQAESAEEAARRVEEVLVRARQAGRRLVFKKIDSTLRGPVGAELAALLRNETTAPVFFTPANPAAGRTVRDGVLRVRGVPLAESEFRNDPRTPARHSAVARILSESGEVAAAEVTLEFLRQPRPDWAAAMAQAAGGGRRLFLCDAETDEDLRRMIAAAFRLDPAPVLVGSGALALALAGAKRSLGSRSAPSLRKPCLFVRGSAHPMSHRQMAAAGVDVFVHGEHGGEEKMVQILDTALGRHGAAGLAAPAEPGEAGAIGAVLGRMAAALHRRRPLRTLVATGGETARAVAGALGGDRLDIVGEFAPGVAASEMPTPGGPVLLVTKPGGFGDDGTWRRLRELLA